MTNYIFTAAGLGEYPGQDATTRNQTTTITNTWGGICWDIANNSNQNIFTPHQITYPSNGYALGGTPLNYNDRITTGIANGVYLIQQLLPTDNFVLMGHNQGAHIASGILQELQTGTLTDFMPQLLAGLTLANPLREFGHTFIGDPIGATGQGIASQLLSGTPDLWWDITNEWDLLANIPQDLASALNGMWQGITTLNPLTVPQIAKAFLAAVKNETDTLGDLLQTITGIATGNDDLLKWLVKSVELLTISGPASFLSTAGTTLQNFTTLATNYLNSFTL